MLFHLNDVSLLRWLIIQKKLPLLLYQYAVADNNYQLPLIFERACRQDHNNYQVQDYRAESQVISIGHVLLSL